MTRQEALDILTDNRVFTHACESTEEEQGQALDIAIKALEQEPMVEIDLYSVIKQKYIERSKYLELIDKIRNFEEAMAEFADGGIYIQVSDVLNILHKYIEEV